MWYQTFWFTQLLIIAGISLTFYVFLYRANKSWRSFVVLTLIFLVLNIFLIFFTVKHRQKLDRFKQINYQIKKINDLSDFDGDKYLATVITDPGLKEGQLKVVISKANKQVLNTKGDAKIIWLSIFDSASPEFNNTNKNNPHFIAQTQWKKKDYSGFLPQSFVGNDSYKGIEISFRRKL